MQNVAIVGAGIAGLMAAHELHDKGIAFKLFEAASCIGGHVQTRRFSPTNNPIELGVFMHDPKAIHPLMNAYAKKWGIKVRPFDLTVSFTSQSFEKGPNWSTEAPWRGKFRDLYVFFRTLAVSLKKGKLMKDASYLWKLNAFVGKMESYLKDPRFQNASLEDFICQEPAMRDLVEQWIMPHLMCWWGVTKSVVLQSSFAVVLDSMWKVTQNKQYIFEDGWDSLIDRIVKDFKERIVLSCPVLGIASLMHQGKICFDVQTAQGLERFDQVILACPPQKALEILDNPLSKELEILSGFDTCETTVYLHRDKSWMPKRSSWSTINFLMDEKGSYCSFWPGRLFKERDEIFLTWGENLQKEPDQQEQKVLWPRTLPTTRYTQYCKRIAEIQGKRGLWFCGAHVHALGDAVPSLWHENAFRSGIAVAEAILETLDVPLLQKQI